MSSDGSRLWLMLACALGVLGGCASVPPAPATSAKRTPSRQRRVRRLAVQVADRPARRPATTPTSQRRHGAAAAASGVQPASATMPPTCPRPPARWWPAARRVRRLGSAAVDSRRASARRRRPARVSIDDVKTQGREEKKGFELSDLAPENIYKNIEEGGRLRPRREDRPGGHAGRQDAVPREEVQGGGGQVRHGRRPLARLAAGGRRPVPEGRERVLLRPVSQGPRHLSAAC